MNQIKETEKLLIFEEIQGATTNVYRQHKEDEQKEFVKLYDFKRQIC